MGRDEMIWWFLVAPCLVFIFATLFSLALFFSLFSLLLIFSSLSTSVFFLNFLVLSPCPLPLLLSPRCCYGAGLASRKKSAGEKSEKRGVFRRSKKAIGRTDGVS